MTLDPVTGSMDPVTFILNGVGSMDPVTKFWDSVTNLGPCNKILCFNQTLLNKIKISRHINLHNNIYNIVVSSLS